jgi:hypothetical protein
MVLQSVDADGARWYQCECGATLSVSMNIPAPPPSFPIVTTGKVYLTPRTPVPAAFYKAFEGDDEEEVKA